MQAEKCAVANHFTEIAGNREKSDKRCKRVSYVVCSKCGLGKKKCITSIHDFRIHPFYLLL